MRNKNTIVILQYDKWEITKLLLDDLAKHESENVDRIVLVDNGSTESATWKGLYKYMDESSLPIVPERLSDNVGFTLGFSHGLKLATEELAEPAAIFAISNDVRIHGKFIQQADDLLFGAKRCLVGNRHINWDSGWNTFKGITFDYLEGFFLAMTSDGWRDVNYFDPAYAPYDMEDVDLSTTAKKKGYRLVSLNNPNIVHQGGGTLGYNREREAITLRNKAYFEEKWTK